MNGIYKEHGYRSANQGWAYSYLFPRLLSMLEGTRGSIIDLGCGNGAVARALISEGYDAYGVDASESGIALANAEAPGRFFVMDLSAPRLPALLEEQAFKVAAFAGAGRAPYLWKSMLIKAKAV